jgi:hypothetical protein
MNEAGNFSVDLMDMRDVDWPKLCYYAIYEPNMIKSLDKDGNLSFAHWKTTSTSWDRFKLSRRGAISDRGGGNRWDIEDQIDPNKDREVYKENECRVQNYVTSYGWCCRDQVIKLADIGLSNEIMDKMCPTIEISEWFCARFDCGCIFCIRVELLDAKKEVVKFFEHSVVTEQWIGGELGWRKIQHKFDAYSPGVRFLRFADAGKDTQFWAGHYGSKMAAAWARVTFA